jgi:hypothetical protein
MGSVLPFPLDKARAQAMLRALPSGRVFFTRHAEKRMFERGISAPDVLDCLRKGRVTEGPARMPKGAWRLTLAWFRAGHEISAVAELDEDAGGAFAVIVTAMD